MNDKWKDEHKNLSPEETRIAEALITALTKGKNVSSKSEHSQAGLALGFEMIANAAKEIGQGDGQSEKLMEMASSVVCQGNEFLKGTPDEGIDFESMQRVRYEESGNPLYAWMAMLGEVGKSNLPDWLKTYLGSCALGVFGLSVNVSDDPDLKRKKLDSAVRRAFGFNGRKHFAEHIVWMHDQDVDWAVDEERDKGKPVGETGYYPTEEVGSMYSACGRHIARLYSRSKKWQELFQEQLASKDE
ncbi:MAG: hypothetical protein JEY79_12015 [Pseudodesulfovibrio sp.]|nr:hypothetical protein [Pseudodesulfovibrio sp.]